ncbi:hypothetical protein A2U01_0063327, partial [Trifolium medium]|nr:hypothetical protein [Trifolium medium]
DPNALNFITFYVKLKDGCPCLLHSEFEKLMNIERGEQETNEDDPIILGDDEAAADQ